MTADKEYCEDPITKHRRKNYGEMARKHQIEAYLKNLRSREPLTEFRETDWLAMVDYITVHSKNDIRVTFKDGTEIKA